MRKNNGMVISSDRNSFSSLHLKILSQKHLLPIWQSGDLHELEFSILAGARITNLLLGKQVLAWSIGFSLISGRERWEFFTRFSVFSCSINSLIKLMVALLPMSVLEQTQSPILKQEDLPLSITSNLPSILPPPHCIALLLSFSFSWSSLMSPVTHERGLRYWGLWEGQCQEEELSREFGVCYLPCCQHGWKEVRDKSRWMDLEKGRVEERSGERESKARETKSKLPSAVSVQSHSSTRQTSIKYSSGLGSSVSSATNGVSSSASSCECQS